MIPLTFTDEDLRLMKKALDGKDYIPEVWTTDISALIARLEAAEKVVACHILLEREMINYDSFMSNLKAWREVAGKQPKGQNAT